MHDRQHPSEIASPGPLVVFDDVAKSFGDVEAVRGINVAIEQGAFVAIIGPSGCGKTTTLRMLAGLETPTRGEIRLRGRRINEVRPWERSMPLVWQSLALFPFLDVLGNVTFGLRMTGLGKAERRRRAMEWLKRLDIDHLADRDISILSGGQLQRVALARALVTEPEILLLDEPLSALDAHLVVRMQSELTQLQRQLGITFIYVTHNQSEAFAMANRVIIMNEGRIEQIGTPREVYRRPRTHFVAEFVGTNNLITGKLKDVSDEVGTIDTGLGTLRAKLDSRVSPGEHVIVVASADMVVIGRKPRPGENAISGTFISEEFVGTVVTLHLEVGQGENFRVQVQQHALERLNLMPQQEVTVCWQPADCYVLPGDGDERKAHADSEHR